MHGTQSQGRGFDVHVIARHFHEARSPFHTERLWSIVNAHEDRPQALMLPISDNFRCLRASLVLFKTLSEERDGQPITRLFQSPILPVQASHFLIVCTF